MGGYGMGGADGCRVGLSVVGNSPENFVAQPDFPELPMGPWHRTQHSSTSGDLHRVGLKPAIIHRENQALGHVWQTTPVEKIVSVAIMNEKVGVKFETANTVYTAVLAVE